MIHALITTAMATFICADIEDAQPTKHFALPPYKAEPLNEKQPDGLHCVMNGNGFNCLSFESMPGAKFTSKEAAYAIAEKWNKK